jgi:hypothetical protein
VIDPHAVGTIAQWTAVLGLGETTLLREVRRRRLRASRRGGRYYVLGEWLLQWLETGVRDERRDAARKNGVAGGDR